MIADYLQDNINVTFGWGTALITTAGTPNNFVMKAYREVTWVLYGSEVSLWQAYRSGDKIRKVIVNT